MRRICLFFVWHGSPFPVPPWRPCLPPVCCLLDPAREGLHCILCFFEIDAPLHYGCCCLASIVRRATRKKGYQQRAEELDIWESLHVERTVLRSLVYILLVIVASFTAFMNLIYGVTFSSSENKNWLTSVLIGIVTGKHHLPLTHLRGHAGGYAPTFLIL